jgi:hypothetical protein
MKIGTKSLLFGVHQIFWHPYVVYKAWCYLYGRPTWKEFVCIFIHDWGYWGCSDMDGEDGLFHPVLGGNIANRLFGIRYWKFCLCHSRSYIEHMNIILMSANRLHHEPYWEPSKLCWADKLSFTFEPRWFYLFRACLSGELEEYRISSVDDPGIPLCFSDKDWFERAKKHMEGSIPPEIMCNSRKLHNL